MKNSKILKSFSYKKSLLMGVVFIYGHKCGWAQAVKVGENDLSIHLGVEARELKSGDPVLVKIEIYNESISEKQVDVGCFSQLGIMIVVENSSGQILPPASPLRSPAPGTRIISLPAHGYFGVSVDLQRLYPNVPWGGNLLAPGIYKVSAFYQAVRPGESISSPFNLKNDSSRPRALVAENVNYWTGRLKSTPILLSIKELPRLEIKSIERDLDSADSLQVSSSMEKVRTLKIIELVPKVEQILEKNQNGGVGKIAAIVLHELAQPRSLDVMIQSLLSTDRTIRSESALGIRRLWAIPTLRERIRLEAVPRLLLAADAQHFPDGYIAACGTLREMKNVEVIPIVKKNLAIETDEERKRILESTLEAFRGQQEP